MESRLPRRRLARAVAWGALLFLAACAELGPGQPPDRAPQAQPPSSAEPGPLAASEPPDTTRGPPALTAEEAAEVERLLVRADQAIREDHLTYPSKDSALDLYDRVRLLDPGNEEARWGLERIVERYLELALDASRQGRFDNARALLNRARLVDPRHPGIAPAAHQVAMMASAERQVIPLDGERLRTQDPQLTDTLRQAGVASRADGCRAQITARSDSEGRWIYQQMSGAPGDARITADLALGSPPRIEVLCFEASP